MNSVKQINTKHRTYYFFHGMLNIKNLDPNKIKIDEKPNKNILISYVGYVTSNSAKTLYPIINKNSCVH